MTGRGPLRVAFGDPREILALVCYGLGYRPSQSLVLVGLRVDHTALVMRTDLPEREDLIDVLATVIPPLRHEHITGVVTMLFTPTDPPLDGPDATWAQTAAAVLAEIPLPVHDLIWVGPRRYRSVWCTDPCCCPLSGRPVAEALPDTFLAATEVAAGAPCAATVEDLLAGGRPRDVLDVQTVAVAEVGDARSWLDAWTGWLPHPDQVDWARAVAGINRLRYRDAVMVSALVPGLTPVAAYDMVADRIGQLLSRCPDADRVAASVAFLAALASRAPAGWRAHPLAAAAFLTWQTGHATKARLLAQAASEDDQACSLADLITQLIQATVSPSWIPTGPTGPQ